MQKFSEEEKIPEAPLKDVTNYYFGGVIDKDQIIKPTVCARAITTNLKDGRRICYVKQCGGEFFDPTDISYTYKKKFWKMRRVGDRAFDLYIQFLGYPDRKNQGKKTFKFKAERES